MKKLIIILLITIEALSFKVLAQNSTKEPNIIPLPQRISTQSGLYKFPKTIDVRAENADEIHVASFIQEYFKNIGREVNVLANPSASIQLNIDKTVENPEGYVLTIDNDGVKIKASTGAGLFYGVQSFLQLLPVKASVDLAVPFISVHDQPAFKWRGSMLDVARHFFPVSFIKKYIDFLAVYKINTFHWHLTDDQGWRIEIKKYPRLTEVAAFRKETLIGAQHNIKPENYTYDGIRYGGFYTQEEIKEVVEYAQKRYITIVPEIEMPGHSVAVLAAYPELACKPGNYETFPRWGITDDIVCPTEKTFQFFENVLAEVVELFPGKYIHIGGDEAPKKVWRESEEVKKIMKENKITEVQKVQGWFNSRIEKFLAKKGKKMIGWDEILEGGISSNATVMSWRGEKGGIEAAKHGNNVVMSPTTHLYFDYGQHPVEHYQNEPLMICCYLPLEKVYSYNPLPKELTKEQQKYILGTQANLWTEYITTGNKVEYSLFPRLLALSEIAWTPHDKKNYQNFEKRVSHHFARLDEKRINYRVPHPEGLSSDKIQKSGDKAKVTLSSIVPGAEIRYTLDGHIPDETTDLYTSPIEIPMNRNIKVMAVTITPGGRRSSPVELVIP